MGVSSSKMSRKLFLVSSSIHHLYVFDSFSSLADLFSELSDDSKNKCFIHVSPMQNLKLPAEGIFSTSAVTFSSSFFSSQLFTASSFLDSLSVSLSSVSGPLPASSSSFPARSFGLSSGSAADCSLAVSSEQELVLMDDLSGASFRACTRS